LGERQRGRLTSVSERTQYVTWIREAKESGARLPLACEEAGISLRTYKRWYQNGKVLTDKRPDAVRTEPANKLSASEQAIILNVSNEKRFASLPPTQIVPTLLDEGLYYGSESTFYRVLKPNLATRLDVLARNMKVNRHKTMAMEYLDEQAALETEQTKEQRAEASQEAELAA